MQPNQDDPYVPPADRNPTIVEAVRFPLRRFCITSLLPAGLSTIAGFTKIEPFVYIAIFLLIPCSIDGAVMFADYSEKVGKRSHIMGLFVWIALMIFDTIACFVGCSIGSIIRS